VHTWNLLTIESPEGTRDPHVIHEGDRSRGVLLVLNAGQSLDEHEVRESTWALVVEGAIEVSAAGSDEALTLEQGSLVYWNAQERRSIASPQGARMLMILTPWPGEGHYTAAERDSQAAV
jgi:quercetin dioxygenase-like cupin family protein